jgi:hypothetical protein
MTACTPPHARHVLAHRSSHKPESKEQELALEIYDTCPIFSLRFEVRSRRSRRLSALRVCDTEGSGTACWLLFSTLCKMHAPACTHIHTHTHTDH